MEINVNVRIDLGDKTMGLVGRMLGAIGADGANNEGLAADGASTGAEGCALAADAASTGAEGGTCAEETHEKTARPKARGGKGKKTEAASEVDNATGADNAAGTEGCAQGADGTPALPVGGCAQGAGGTDTPPAAIRSGAGGTPTPPEVGNVETAENVGNEMPFDDGSRKGERPADNAGGTPTPPVDPTVSAEAPYGTSIWGIPCKRDVSGGHDELVVKMREAMSDCWTRFIGEDYKNRVTEPKYKRYYQPLKSNFMRLANTLGAKKPSELDDDNLRTFIMEVDLLSPNPETGEIEKKNFF